MEELYKKYNKDELLSLLIHKWAGRGFIAWVLSMLLFRFSPLEFGIALVITLGFSTWMIRGEWRQYKRWLQEQKESKG